MEIVTQPQKSLYNIRAEHLNLLSLIEENEGELTPEIESQLSLTQEQFQDKAISYGFILKQFDNTTEIIDREIKRLKDLQARAEKQKDLFKQRLADAMLEFGVEKIKTPTLTLSFRKSESIEITDEEQIPFDYLEQKVVITISKTKIKEAIKEGLMIPGAQLVTKANLQVK